MLPFLCPSPPVDPTNNIALIKKTSDASVAVQCMTRWVQRLEAISDALTARLLVINSCGVVIRSFNFLEDE